MVGTKHCCDESTGNFCNECGRPLGPSLASLLSHVMHNAKVQRKQYNGARKYHGDNVDDEGTRRFIERWKVRAEKWETWAYLLGQVLWETGPEAESDLTNKKF